LRANTSILPPIEATVRASHRDDIGLVSRAHDQEDADTVLIREAPRVAVGLATRSSRACEAHSDGGSSESDHLDMTQTSRSSDADPPTTPSRATDIAIDGSHRDSDREGLGTSSDESSGYESPDSETSDAADEDWSLPSQGDHDSTQAPGRLPARLEQWLDEMVLSLSISCLATLAI
jgi:hypothetical protein